MSPLNSLDLFLFSASKACGSSLGLFVQIQVFLEIQVLIFSGCVCFFVLVKCENFQDFQDFLEMFV